jgi:hypothetical protein
MPYTITPNNFLIIITKCYVFLTHLRFFLRRSLSFIRAISSYISPLFNLLEVIIFEVSRYLSD